MKSWTKTSTGYEALDGRAIVARTGKTWTLTLDNVAYDLGHKASFDHAEAIIAKEAMMS